MPFRFPLATVLRLREIEERRQERLLAAILATIAQASHNLVLLDARLAEVAEQRRAGLLETLNSAALQDSYALSERLKEHRAAAAAALHALEEQREAQIIAYQLAHQAHELLATMRRDQSQAYLAAQARQEQKSLDDIFLARRGRR